MGGGATMPEVSITTALSDDDRESIIQGVLAAIKPLLDTRPELVDADTMAAITGVSPATLDRLRRAGQIPATPIRRHRKATGCRR
jgi:hypothetical protein